MSQTLLSRVNTAVSWSKTSAPLHDVVISINLLVFERFQRNEPIPVVISISVVVSILLVARPGICRLTGTISGGQTAPALGMVADDYCNKKKFYKIQILFY